MSDEEAAATKIQALQRGRGARREVEEKRKEKEEQDKAASKIQALQRGKEARRQADEKRELQKKKKEEAEAALKIQSLQRGRKARENAEIRRAQKHGPFARPFVSESEHEAVVALRSQRALQCYTQFDDLVDALQEQFPARGIDRGHVYYSTAAAPDVFANIITQKKLDQCVAYRKVTEVHKRGDLGIVGFWEYGEKKKKKFRIKRKKVEGKPAGVLTFEQECSGERGLVSAELVPPGEREKDRPPAGFAAQWMAKLKNGSDEPEGIIWLRLSDDLTLDTVYRPEGVDPKQAAELGKLVRLTAAGKGRGPEPEQKEEVQLSKKKKQEEEREKRARAKEIPRELALRAHDISCRADQLAAFQSMRHVKVVFTGYQPTSTFEAFRNHISSLASCDVALALREYTGRSVLRVVDDTSGSVTEHKGTQGAREVWVDLCAKLKDTSDLAVPVQEMDEEGAGGLGHAFYVWRCPASGFARVASTLLFDRCFKIVRHELAVSYTPKDPPKKKKADE